MKMKSLNPFTCIAHPFDQFHALRFKGGVSKLYPAVIVAAWMLISVMERQNTGFLFNTHRAADLNIFIIIAKTVVLFIFWVAGSWTVSTFAGGIGRLWEIIDVSAYALLPYLALKLVNIGLSHVFVLGESGFLGYIALAGLLWSGGLLLIGLRQVNNLDLLETFIHMLLTVVSMAVMVFLCVLFYTLTHQLWIFFYTIIREIMFRL